jgi:hypothetical protein
VRPQEAWLARSVSAMNRTLARLERPARPYDFGLLTGDCMDSAQHDELQWFLQLMDGQPGLHTDSGADDDPVPGPGNDPKDPFDPVAFPAPWLFVPGNHDVEIVGTNAPTDALRAQALGTRAPTGTRDYRRWWAPVVTGTVLADPDRRVLDRRAILAGLRAGPATPGPVGHGYPESPDLALGAHYAYDAIPGLLRVLALDTNDPSGGSPGLVTRATVDGWLRPQLERATADGVLVLLASHQATSSIDRRQSEFGPELPDAVAPAELEQLVAGYPVVVAWLVGHEHDHRVRAIRGADAAHPGYWEIETSALADWPAQSRLVEIVDNGNGTLSLFGTVIDADTDGCLERRFRRLALMQYLAGWERDHQGAAPDRNVELLLPVPAAARARVAAAALTAPARLESETTLRGAP